MRLVLFTPPEAAPHEVQRLNAMFESGLQCVHVRKPTATAASLCSYLDAIKPQHLHKVVLHQHHQLAQEYPLKGIHYRERDRPEPPLRPLPGLTQSTGFHSTQDLARGWGPALSYAFLSPIFNSISKPGYLAAGFSQAELATVLGRAADLQQPQDLPPVLALGGVTGDRLAQIAELGFAGAAVLGCVWEAEDPVAELARLQAACNALPHGTW